MAPEQKEMINSVISQAEAKKILVTETSINLIERIDAPDRIETEWVLEVRFNKTQIKK